MAENVWKSEEIVAATSGNLRGQAFVASGVSIDTRSLKAGDIFVALVGENFDGHNFLAQAAEKGAAAAIVSRMPAGAPKNLPLVAVHDTQLALEELGRMARQRSEARIIGVTGSVGKTSAKEMLKLALAPYGKVFATAGNYNNHIGLPLMLANMPQNTDFGVFEMGMNHTGEIGFLSRIVQPHLCIITTVDAVHLEFFESVDAIARAKAEIFSGMGLGGKAVLDSDNPHFPLLRQLALDHHLEVIAFGSEKEADFQLKTFKADAKGTKVLYRAGEREGQFHLASLGAHWPKLALGVLALVAGLDLPLEKAEQALSAFNEQPGRGQLLVLPWKNGTITLIDDSYNASPVSMRGALEKLATITPAPGGRRLAVLGEMLELGTEAARYHAEIAPIMVARGIDRAFLAGSGMQALHDALPEALQGGFRTEAKALEALLINALQPGDVVLIKGSHGSKVYQLAEALKNLASPKLKETA